MTTTKEKMVAYLEERPPCLAWTACELCDSALLLTIANHDRYGLPVRFTICRRCGLVVLNPRWDQAAYGRFYTDFYHPLLRESGIEIAFDNWQERFEKMMAATGLQRQMRPGMRVLEIGGGEGRLAAHIREQYRAEVVLVEPNAGEAAVAAAKGLEVHARVFEECQLEPASFDLVVLMRTVDHLIHASMTFELIRALLRPGGRVLLDAVDYFRRMAFRRSTIAPLKIDHCYYFSPETLPAMLQRCGLQPLVTDIVTIPGQIVALAQAGEATRDEALWARGELRYLEWEQMANRPTPVTQPVPLARLIRMELGWLGKRVRQRLNGRQGKTR